MEHLLSHLWWRLSGAQSGVCLPRCCGPSRGGGRHLCRLCSGAALFAEMQHAQVCRVSYGWMERGEFITSGQTSCVYTELNNVTFVVVALKVNQSIVIAPWWWAAGCTIDDKTLLLRCLWSLLYTSFYFMVQERMEKCLYLGKIMSKNVLN